MSAARAFRFAAVSPRGSLQAWPDFARKAEDLGFSTIGVPDHFGQQLAPLLALASAASVTSTIRLATIVLNNDFRHPATLAKEAAMVDALSNGRLELGLGAGWELSDYQKTGLRVRPPGERLERLAEAIAICKLFFTQEVVNFHGKHYQIEGLDAFPKSVQRPHPPIMAGGRRRRLLSFAGREANIVGISMLDGPRTPEQPVPPSFPDKVQWVREAAGARFADIEIQVQAANVAVTDDPASALEVIAARLNVSPAEAQASPTVLVGSVDAIAERLLAWRERCGVSYYAIIGPAAVDAFAPVIARLGRSVS